jgi:hypothetical protein
MPCRLPTPTRSAVAALGILLAAACRDAVIAPDESPAAPVITAISPAMLIPGETATVSGTGFGPVAAEHTVTIAGVTATVSAATATQLIIEIPGRAAFPCEPTREVEVAARVGSGSPAVVVHPLRVAINRQLPPGGAVAILDPDDVRCNELADGGARFVISVLNASTTGDATAGFTLRGTPLGPDAARAPVATQRAFRLPESSVGVFGASPGDRHWQILEANRRLLERLGPPRLGVPDGGLPPEPVPDVGDVETFRIGQVGNPPTCDNYVEIDARAAWVGAKAVIFEDVEAPLAGTMDAYFQALGEEFEAVMYPVLEEYFGDPLVMNAQLRNNGRLFMVFSDVINDFGIFGVVFVGNFFDPESCPMSNRAEILFARVPTDPGSGFPEGLDSQTADAWLWGQRVTVMHEAKHIVSVAERLSRELPREVSWLEEGTAVIAQELYGRAVYGYARGENTTFDASLRCETPPGTGACEGKPAAVWFNFQRLHKYFRSVERFTPLRAPDDTPAPAFYGASWWLNRWAADHSGRSDVEFFRNLTQSGLSGTENLEAVTGRGFAELLADWSLASVLDDLPGFTPLRTQLTHPSWNLPDMFLGMHEMFPEAFDPVPLEPHALAPGAFEVTVPLLAGGTAALFEIRDAGPGGQLLELTANGDGPAPAELGLAIARVD